MSETGLRVLLIEDNPSDADLLAEVLTGEDMCVQIVHSECMEQAESQLERKPALDVILLDLGLPDSDGLVSLERAIRAAPHLPIIVLTGLEDEVIGVEAVRKGAQDYLVKGQTTPRLLLRVIHHATERKRLEESLRSMRELAERRAAEAEAANQAKSQFLANISHELRTPMNAILGMVEFVLRRELDSTTRDCLNTARESAGILLSLLNDLLDSAKIESGNLELEAAPFRMHRVLEQTSRILSVRAREKGLAFHHRVPDDLPDAVIGDKVRLRQVLMNLVGNAIKFTQRGEVAVSVRVESLLLEEVSLGFAVRDTGIGIPRGDLERIFKPFTQADRSTARRFGGTGLGLSISANLVAMMGGRIWAESEPGQGSTFYFTMRLPLAKGLPPEPGSLPCSPVLSGTPLRLLLVEDNPANQKLATYMLKEGGHAIDIARDGPQALQMTKDDCYDVILMDLQMPGMDGLEATASIRAAAAGGRRVPIIAMTAHAMKSDRERCLAAGMDGYLSKPIDAAEMFAVIESVAIGSARSGTGASSSAPRVTTANEPARVFDYHLALERCCRSQEILGEIVECLFDEADRLLPLMQSALEHGDLEEVSRLGHRLKGTLVCLAAEPAVDAAVVVECCGKGSKDGAEQAVRVLEQEVEALKQAVATYRPAGPSGKDA